MREAKIQSHAAVVKQIRNGWQVAFVKLVKIFAAVAEVIHTRKLAAEEMSALEEIINPNNLFTLVIGVLIN